MDETAARVLDRVYADAARHDAAEPDRLRRWRVLERESGKFAAFLTRAVSARVVLEVGTSRGVSTIWLADAVRATGGVLNTVDTDADAQRAAADNVRAAGLAAQVRVRHGDGGAVLAGTADASVDLLFLDAERTEYAGWWPDVCRVLRPGGLLIADNAESHAAELAPLRELLLQDNGFTVQDLSIGKGMLLAVREHLRA